MAQIDDDDLRSNLFGVITSLLECGAAFGLAGQARRLSPAQQSRLTGELKRTAQSVLALVQAIEALPINPYPDKHRNKPRSLRRPLRG